MEGLMADVPLPRHPLQRSLSQSSLNMAAGPVSTAADIIRLAGDFCRCWLQYGQP